MKKLNSLQRKLVYLGGIIILSIPILLLGQPGRASVEATDTTQARPAERGGKLDAMRKQYDLGQSDLGAVDPSSATMNLVLLGLRGVATCILQLEAQEHQDHKNWAELEQTTESIIKLQPHFHKVWHFKGWNLAYNVSQEWDAVEDRYFWVKKGIKIHQKGVRQNRKVPDLYWHTGNIIAKKIGRSDEWVQFRRFFMKKDPDPRFAEKNWEVDREINERGKDYDNYLMAKEWFEESMRVLKEDNPIQHIMAPTLFRSYPARSQIDFAEVHGREVDENGNSRIGEQSREAWDKASDDWIAFGQVPILVRFNSGEFGEVQLEIRSDDEYQEIADKYEVDEGVVKDIVRRYHELTNYPYWRTRVLAEREENTMLAHKEIFEGQELYKKGEFEEAAALLQKGMRRFETLLDKYPQLIIEDLTVEEGMVAILVYRYIRQTLGEPPEIHPLKKLWNEHKNRLPIFEKEMRRRMEQ